MPRAAESSRRAAPLALVPLLIGGCRSTHSVGNGSPAPREGTDAESGGGGAAGAESQDAAPEDEGGGEGEAKDDRELPVHGTLSTRFRGRWNSDASDNDLFEVLTLDVGNPV